MDAPIVTNPDGSTAVLIPENPSTAPSAPQMPQNVPSNPQFKFQTNPFPEHDRVAMENLMVMQKQDAAAWAQHEAPDSDFTRMMREDASAAANHETFVTYNTKAHSEDHQATAAIHGVDAQLQRAVAATAAGPDPILADQLAQATPGMDWLERMKAHDEAVRGAMERNDAQFRSS